MTGHELDLLPAKVAGLALNSFFSQLGSSFGNLLLEVGELTVTSYLYSSLLVGIIQRASGHLRVVST